MINIRIIKNLKHLDFSLHEERSRVLDKFWNSTISIQQKKCLKWNLSPSFRTVGARTIQTSTVTTRSS